MNQKIYSYPPLISRLKAEYTDTEARLIKEERRDEASLYRIRENICDIFQSLFLTVQAQYPEEQFIERYREKSDSVVSVWKEHLDQARSHMDSKSILIEETKLDTARILSTQFLQITGGTAND